MKRLLLCALLFCAFTASAQDYLKTFRNKTSKQIANVTHLQRRDTTFYHLRIGDYDRDLSAAIEARGLTPLDFAAIKAALDTSIFRQNRLYFPPGTYTVDSLGIYSPITLSGVGIKRIKTTDTSPYYGSVIKSTNSTGLRLLTAMESGVHLRDISFQGTKQNGHGVYFQRLPISGNISTTLGGYSLTRVNSFNHGGDGFHLVGADGVILNGVETNGNIGYGLSIVSPKYDGLTNSGNTAGGTTNLVMVGRHRANKMGGVRIGDQAAPLLLGVQAIADTTMGVWLDRGRSRAWLLGIDSELQVPANTANPRTIGLRVDNYNGFYMGQSFVGASHSYGSFVADAGTNTTTIVDAALVNYGVNDFLVGSEVNNTTRSSGKIKITDYVASTGTITLASAIAGQTTGDSYTLTKKVNIAVLVDSLQSGIFVNNNMAHSGDSDTTFAVSGYGYATFVNNINFDPIDNAKAIGGAEFKWLNYNLSGVDSLSGGDARITANTEIKVSASDSIVINTTSTDGVEVGSSGGGKVAIQPDGIADVTLFARKASDGSNKDLRIYYDANSGVGFTQSNIEIGGSNNTSNTLSVENPDDVQKWSFGVPVRFSGADSSERQFEIQNMSIGQRPAAPNSGFVKFYSRGDTAYVLDDNNVERSLYAGSALGDVVGPASSTDNAVVRFDGTTGKLVQNTSTTTLSDAGAFSFADGVTQIFNPNGTSSGLNVGSQAGDPSTPANGDVWYDATANELTARINGANVALGAGGGGGITVAQARQHTGWTSDATTSQDTLSRVYRLDKANIQFQVVDADNDSVLVIPQSLYPFNYKDATTQLAAYDSTGRFYSALGYDAVGAAALEFGSGDVPTITLTTDGTGNGEVVLPAQSVTGSEITNDSLTPTQVDEGQNFTWTANQRFNHSAYFNADADSFKVDLRTQLYPLDLEVGNARKWAVDSTGASTQAGSVTVVGSPGLLIGNGATSAGSIRISEDSDDGSNYTEITVPAMSANITYTLPPDDGDAGEQLQTNGSGVLTWEAAGSGSSSDMTTTFKIEEDWVSGAANTSGAMGKDWQRTIATSGTTTHQAGESGRPGIMRFFCANSAGSTAALHTDPSSILVNSTYVLTTSVRFSSLGTAGSNGAYYRVGFMDDVGATIPTDGAWIEFNVDSSATRWRAITGNGGTRTITTYTGSTVSTSTWYKLTITPNSGGTSIVFAVDGTTIATHTTNLPASGVGVAMVAAAVTASSTKYMEQDYVQVINTGLSR